MFGPEALQLEPDQSSLMVDPGKAGAKANVPTQPWKSRIGVDRCHASAPDLQGGFDTENAIVLGFVESLEAKAHGFWKGQWGLGVLA